MWSHYLRCLKLPKIGRKRHVYEIKSNKMQPITLITTVGDSFSFEAVIWTDHMALFVWGLGVRWVNNSQVNSSWHAAYYSNWASAVLFSELTAVYLGLKSTCYWLSMKTVCFEHEWDVLLEKGSIFVCSSYHWCEHVNEHMNMLHAYIWHMCSIRVVNERRLLGYRRVARIRLMG